jgi:tetratricopeptide (TPR) repeat protein
MDDHREDRHGVFVYDEAIRVPLVVRAPGLPRGAVRPEQVRTVDVATTVLDLAGVGGTLGVGGSLRAPATGAGPAPDPAAYVESEKSRLFFGGSGLKGFRTDRQKYLWAPRPELYDLVADPGEVDNLAERDVAAAEAAHARFRAIVRDLLARDLAVVEAADLDETTAEGLRSLGYVTGTGAPAAPGSPEEETALRGLDPKDLVDAVLSGRDVSNGFYRDALARTRRFETTVAPPESAPELAPLWSMAMQNRAAAQLALGEYDSAAASYREALRHDPGNPEARQGWPFALNLAGRPGEAVRAADELLRDAPGEWRVRLHRALGLALQGRTGPARDALTRLADECPIPDVSRVAGLYRDALGTPDERRLLGLYRASGGHATR